MNLMFLKPKDQKKPPKLAVRVFRDEREVCDLTTKAGRDEYMGRVRQMWERQGKRCCLEGLVKDCPGYLRLAEATFDHDEGRGHGGGHRDDRIEIPDGKGGMKEINGAAHAWCNSKKGSCRLSKLLDLSEVL